MYSTPIKTSVSLSQWKDQELFVRDNPQFAKPQISYLMRNRLLNGLDSLNAVRKVGRKLYIHEERFAEWLERFNVDTLSCTTNQK